MRRKVKHEVPECWVCESCQSVSNSTSMESEKNDEAVTTKALRNGRFSVSQLHSKKRKSVETDMTISSLMKKKRRASSCRQNKRKKTFSSSHRNKKKDAVFKEKVCEVCGDNGGNFKHLLVTCSVCNTTFEHVYCMRRKVKHEVPKCWVCESCQSVNDSTSMESEKNDEAVTTRALRNGRFSVSQLHSKKRKSVETDMTISSLMKKKRRASSRRQNKRKKTFSLSRRNKKKDAIYKNFDANKFTFVDSNIHISSHWHGFDCIRSFLSAPQLQKLRGSCFGFLLDLDKSLKPSNMIIHSLLLHQECNSNINELQLSFGHHKAKFGIAEFGFITGLNCNEFPPDFDVIDCPTNRLLNKYFPDKEFIKRNELAEFLMKTNIDDDDDAVKLTKVFIVQNILESKRGDRYIDKFVLRLVDDEQLFENYPWGRRSFNATIGNLSTAVNCRKTGYELCGFPLAFQVWGFEVLPKLGSLFATKVGSSIPKILNWKLTKTARLHTIWRKVFKDPTVVYAPLALFNARRTPDFSSPTMNNDEDIDLMKENGEIKKENAEMRKEHGELRKKIDELNHKITELSGLKMDFEKIKDLVMSLVDKDVVEKETYGEGEKDKHNNLLSGEIVPHSPVILQNKKANDILAIDKQVQEMGHGLF
ncbi:hypothetical protein G4B88_025704 [Cannabis sativa]|uniref:Zinc finger PHD-type domain-containing protein n=1 Tax=Cannabis sativa TaxID=3483 RepID=A0A7J6F4E1_CANSA|nr:hypothetical protein G4B88_025704 [Cannabis sativa]